VRGTKALITKRSSVMHKLLSRNSIAVKMGLRGNITIQNARHSSKEHVLTCHNRAPRVLDEGAHDEVCSSSPRLLGFGELAITIVDRDRDRAVHRPDDADSLSNLSDCESWA
jgi:hypothetical protein